MKIKSVTAQTVYIPVPRPLAFSTRTVAERQYTLVRVTLDSGEVGYGFTYAGNSGGPMITACVEDVLIPHLKGADVRDREALWDAMFRESLLVGRRGAAIRAISAVDIALWDAAGKATGQPLHKMLGAYRDAVPCYASGGYYFPGKGAKGIGDEVRAWKKQGFVDVKIKVGRGDPDEDAKRVAAARKSLGPKGRLFLDANNAWNDVPSALRFLDRVEDYDIGWIEEPFLPDNIEGHAELASRTNIPVATGEIEQTRWGFKALMDAGAASILQTDAGVCGGITEFMRIAQMAAGNDLPIAPHWFSDLHVSLVCAIPNGMIVEHFLDTEVLNIMEIIDRPLKSKDGMVGPKDLPGHGIEFNEKKIAKFSKPSAASANRGF
ncbi:MAG: mandelate racemase/muconate lactonizing enzyme family protein [Acetobacterales bacterium]